MTASTAAHPAQGTRADSSTSWLGRRLVAFFADTVLLSVALMSFAVLLVALTGGIDSRPTELDPLPAWLRTGTSLIGLGYFSLCWAFKGQTPGQKMLGLSVQRAGTRQELSIVQATARWAALGGPLWIASASIPGIVGSLAIVATGVWSVILLISTGIGMDGRGLHDRMARSRVIRTAVGNAG